MDFNFSVLNLSAYNEGERGVNKTGANMSVYMYTVYGNGTNWQPNKKHVLYIWQYIAIQQLMSSTEYLSFVLNVWRTVKKRTCWLLPLAQQKPERYGASGTEDGKGYLFHGAQRPGTGIFVLLSISRLIQLIYVL